MATDISGKLLKFELNTAGVGQLLKCDAMRKGLESIASDKADDCGVGYDYDSVIMGTRVIASVYASTYEAMQDNYENNTLLRVLK